MQTLAEQALANTALISDDALRSIQSIIAAIDEKLTQQINEVLHHPDYQQLESAWRGLHFLVNNTETDEMLKIRVLNISKKEMAQDAEEVQRHRLGPVAAVQEDLRRRVRPVRRPALWLAR